MILAGSIFLLGAASIAAIKMIPIYREHLIWGKITAVDFQHLRTAPPAASIRVAKFNQKTGSAWVGIGKKQLASDKAVKTILHDAFDVPETRIVALTPLPPGKYDFIVSLPDHQLEALQEAIKDKFGLVGRMETRSTDVLILKVANANAPGLVTPANPKANGSLNNGIGRVKMINSHLSTLAFALEQHLKVPVLDRTGLSKRYDIDLKWPEQRLDPNPEALKEAVLDQLGLELKPDTDEVEMLVVDKAK